MLRLLLVSLLCRTGRTGEVRLQHYNTLPNGTRISVSSAAPVGTITDDEISGICKILGHESWVDMAQCRATSSLSLRLQILGHIRQEHYFSHNTFDENVDYSFIDQHNPYSPSWAEHFYKYTEDVVVDTSMLYLQYAYGRRALDLKYKQKNVCIIGKFNWILAKLILELNTGYHVWFFTESYSQPEDWTDLDSLRRTLFYGQFVHIIPNYNSFQWFQQIHKRHGSGFCDILHVRWERGLTVGEVKLVADVSLRDQCEGQAADHRSPVQVIWERRLVDGESMADVKRAIDYGSDNFHWLVATPTERYFGFYLRADTHGYYHNPGSCHSMSNETMMFYFGGQMCKDIKGTSAGAVFNINIDELSNSRLCTGDECSSSTSQSDIIVFISYTNRFHQDYAFGIYNALLQIGYQAHMMGDFNTTMYMELLELAQKENRLLQIVVGIHDHQILSQNYIAVHTEQPWFKLGSAVYPLKLQQALFVWMYCDRHKRDISALYEVPLENVRVVPMYSHPRLNRYAAVEVEPAYDLIFFGSCSKHRTAILDQLRDLAVMNNIILASKCAVALSETVIGTELDHLVLASKIGINLHTINSSSLEVHRVLYLLSMGIPVISERSALDPQTDAEYEQSGAVFFGNSPEDLFEHALMLIRHPGMLSEARLRAREKYESVIKDLLPVREAMIAAEYKMRMR